MQCDPGALSPLGTDHALKMVNLGRWLTGLPEVNGSEALHSGAQACATIMANQRSLSHNPPTNWACYTPAGANSASQSNIHLNYGRGSITDSVLGFSETVATIIAMMWDIGVGYSPPPLGTSVTAITTLKRQMLQGVATMSSVVGMFDHTPCRSLHIPIPVPFRSVGLPQDFGISLGPSALMRDMVVHGCDRPMDRRGIKANRRHLNPARGLVRQCELSVARSHTCRRLHAGIRSHSG